jgi:hypothetical protein
MSDQTIDRAAAIAALGLTVDAVFVPFSRSRNKAEARHSLNWKVTVRRNGRDVLTCDYGAGTGHCPGYKVSTPPAGYRARDRYRAHGKPYPGSTSSHRRPTASEALADFREEICAAECESGVAMEYNWLHSSGDFKPKRTRVSGEVSSRQVPIMPNAVDVIYSLNLDADALNYATFADWAETFGYDTDSRIAEATYRACLAIGLKLRAALGDAGLLELNTILQDY